ncbi:hypothetical protein HDU76_011346, partial [Blyttiomyces sp. JEL0837]
STCSTHPEGCGLFLKEGDSVIFEKSTYKSRGTVNGCCKCRLLKDGGATCTVGMLNAKDFAKSDLNGRTGVVVQLLADSEDPAPRQTS